jgi:hypothetical protein
MKNYFILFYSLLALFTGSLFAHEDTKVAESTAPKGAELGTLDTAKPCDFKGFRKGLVKDALLSQGLDEAKATEVMKKMGHMKQKAKLAMRELLGLPKDAKRIDVVKKLLENSGVTVSDEDLAKVMATKNALKCQLLEKLKDKMAEKDMKKATEEMSKAEKDLDKASELLAPVDAPVAKEPSTVE